MGPTGESGQCQGGDADSCADGGADYAGKKGKFENVLRPFKAFRPAAKRVTRVATDYAFEGVSRRNAERGGDGTGGGPVY